MLDFPLTTAPNCVAMVLHDPGLNKWSPTPTVADEQS